MEHLEKALDHDHLYTIIGSGLTMTGTSDVLGIDVPAAERWNYYTRDYARLCGLLMNQKNVLFLCGDVHNNAFLPKDSSGARPCYEIISSGFGIDNVGIPVEQDRRRNWGLLELDDKEVLVTLREKRKQEKYRIDTQSWGYTLL